MAEKKAEVKQEKKFRVYFHGHVSTKYGCYKPEKPAELTEKELLDLKKTCNKIIAGFEEIK